MRENSIKVDFSNIEYSLTASFKMLAIASYIILLYS